MSEKHVTREKYNSYFKMAGILILVIGILFYLAQTMPALDGIKKALCQRPKLKAI